MSKEANDKILHRERYLREATRADQCLAALANLNPHKLAALLEACDTAASGAVDADEDWLRAAVEDIADALAELRNGGCR